MLWPVARHCHVRYPHPIKLESLPALMIERLSATFGVLAQAVATVRNGVEPGPMPVVPIVAVNTP